MKLSQRWINHLVNLSETGMGYQVVDVYLRTGNVIEKMLVLNCEDLVGFQVSQKGVQYSHKQIPLNFQESDIVDIKLSRI